MTQLHGSIKNLKTELKLFLLQFGLLSSVVIDTRKHRNVAKIRGYIKVCCKFGLNVKSIHDEICIVYGDKQMSFSKVQRWFTKFSSGQESVKDAPYSGRPRSVVTNLTLIRSSSLLIKMWVSLSHSWHK